MREVTIKFKSSKTLELLKSLASYLDFVVSSPSSPSPKKPSDKNKVAIIPADNSIDDSELSKIFSGKNINAAALRKTAWQRSK